MWHATFWVSSATRGGIWAPGGTLAAGEQGMNRWVKAGITAWGVAIFAVIPNAASAKGGGGGGGHSSSGGGHSSGGHSGSSSGHSSSGGRSSSASSHSSSAAP